MMKSLSRFGGCIAYSDLNLGYTLTLLFALVVGSLQAQEHIIEVPPQLEAKSERLRVDKKAKEGLFKKGKDFVVYPGLKLLNYQPGLHKRGRSSKAFSSKYSATEEWDIRFSCTGSGLDTARVEVLYKSSEEGTQSIEWVSLPIISFSTGTDAVNFADSNLLVFVDMPDKHGTVGPAGSPGTYLMHIKDSQLLAERTEPWIFYGEKRSFEVQPVYANVKSILGMMSYASRGYIISENDQAIMAVQTFANKGSGMKDRFVWLRKDLDQEERLLLGSLSSVLLMLDSSGRLGGQVFLE